LYDTEQDKTIKSIAGTKQHSNCNITCGQEAAYDVVCLLDYNYDLLVEEAVLVEHGARGCVKYY